MTKSWVTIAMSAITVGPPFIMGAAPLVGCVVTRSKWTPVAWVIALAIGAVGYTLDRARLSPDHRLAVVAWVPVYQLFVVTLAMHVFFLVFHRRPRYAPTRYAEGCGWDKFFSAVTIFACIMPVVPFLSPR